jgi:alkyldihydroxyacetonephosphate synthase
MSDEIKQMKWWGWGSEDESLSLSDKPHLLSFITNRLGLSATLEIRNPLDFNKIELSPVLENPQFIKDLQGQLEPEQISSDKMERLVHAFGKSFRDLWCVRNGKVKYAPDCVIYPESDEDVRCLLESAARNNVVLVPFGGGTNISGCLEPLNQGRMVVSVDMKGMSRLLHLDSYSQIARFQAGVLGPELETQLNAQGYTLGHFPDSFVYSSLGGWVCTRGAGMYSDKYGKIEDMIISLRMISPSGVLETRTVPKSSNGIDMNHLCAGSEGTLGIVTEVSLKIHQLPKCNKSYGYLFQDFESGLQAVYQCRKSGIIPIFSRLNDSDKTALSMAFRPSLSPLKTMLYRVFNQYLKNMKQININRSCMLISAFAGNEKQVDQQSRQAAAIYKKHGGVNAGQSPGRAFDKSKFDLPHIRDFLLERGIMSDVSETTTTWNNISPLYNAVRQAIEKAIRQTGQLPFVGCHISHNYHGGACLYFTFACAMSVGMELEQYLFIKKAAQDAFINNGATLSHHHAVGLEHLPWLSKDISAAGIQAIRGLKSGLDPENIMNPGKLIPGEEVLSDWGFNQELWEKFES